jgi:hypothetical protein
LDTNLPYLQEDEDRHGNPRVYVRRNGKRVRIREKEGTPEFARAYADAVDRLGPPTRRKKSAVDAPPQHAKGTFGWLGAQYFRSKGDGEFLTLDKDSQRARRNDLEECFRTARNEKDPDPIGNCPLRNLTAQRMKRLIESKGGPGARKNRRKHLSALCAWGVENNHLPSNPVRDIKAGTGSVKGGGYYTWTVEDVKQYLAYWKTGTKQRLALGLLLFSGARRQDMVRLGKQNIKDKWIQYIPLKTLKKRRETSQKPLLPILADIIKTSPCGDLTFLVNKFGAAY